MRFSSFGFGVVGNVGDVESDTRTTDAVVPVPWIEGRKEGGPSFGDTGG